MVALTITAANVLWVSGGIEKDAIFGEALDAGDLVYKSAANTWLKAQNDGSVIEAGSLGLGMALSTADVALARGSVALPGAVVAIGAGAPGIVYAPGATPGDFVPTADLGSTVKVTPAALGIASSEILLMRAYNVGAVIA